MHKAPITGQEQSRNPKELSRSQQIDEILKNQHLIMLGLKFQRDFCLFCVVCSLLLVFSNSPQTPLFTKNYSRTWFPVNVSICLTGMVSSGPLALKHPCHSDFSH